VHLFLATDLKPATAKPEEAEVFEVQWLPLQQAFQMALDGTINDSKTVVALTRALHQDGRAK
jgi:hypothetical protein